MTAPRVTTPDLYFLVIVGTSDGILPEHSTEILHSRHMKTALKYHITDT